MKKYWPFGKYAVERTVFYRLISHYQLLSDILVMHAYLWISLIPMEMHGYFGYACISAVIHGYQQICMDNPIIHGYQMDIHLIFMDIRVISK